MSLFKTFAPLPARKTIQLLLICGFILSAPTWAQDTLRPTDGNLTQPSTVPSRTVFEAAIYPLGADPATAETAILVADDGPASDSALQALERDDLPYSLQVSVGIMDRQARVVEIHFFADQTEAEAGTSKRVPLQKVLIDDRAEVQVEIEHDFTLVLRWIDLRDETAVEVDGEIIYRPSS